MNTCEWLDRAKYENQIVSDYKLAKILAIAPNRISNYRNSTIQMDDELALQVENLLNLPAGTILLDMHAERTKCSKAAKILHDLSKQLTSAAASLFLTFSMIYVTAYPVESMAENAGEMSNTVYYVKSILALILHSAETKTLFFSLFLANLLFIRYLLHLTPIANKPIKQ